MKKKDMLSRTRDAGFTLIELLVVVLVIGVLSGIVVLAVQNSTVDARKKACLSNASALVSALENYRATNATAAGNYPTASNGAAALSGTGTVPSGNYSKYESSDLTTALVPVYIKSIPYTGDAGVTAFVKADTATATVVIKLTGTYCDPKDSYYTG